MRLVDVLKGDILKIVRMGDSSGQQCALHKHICSMLAPFELAPFELRPGEEVAMRCNPFECTAMHVDVLQDAIRRAQHTLVAKDAQAVAGEWTSADYGVAVAASQAASGDWRDMVRAALDAVAYRLTAAPAPTGDVLAPIRIVLDYVRKYDAPKDAHVNELVKWIDERFPKPAPVEKTARELADVLHGARGPWWNNALDELVRRAEKGEAAK